MNKFAEGFIERCRERGVNPFILAKVAQTLPPPTGQKLPLTRPATPATAYPTPTAPKQVAPPKTGVPAGSKPANPWGAGGAYHNAMLEMRKADQTGFDTFMKGYFNQADAAQRSAAMKDPVQRQAAMRAYYGQLSSEQKNALTGTDAFKAMRNYNAQQQFNRTVAQQGLVPGGAAKLQHNAGNFQAAPGSSAAETIARENNLQTPQQVSNFMAKNQRQINSERAVGGIATYIDPRTGQVVSTTGNQLAAQRRAQTDLAARRRALMHPGTRVRALV